MELKMAESVEPTYMISPESPGAMPMAWVMSRVCSVSSQPLDSVQLVLVPSVESSVTGTLFVWCALVK
jgi:hypothetical protein